MRPARWRTRVSPLLLLVVACRKDDATALGTTTTAADPYDVPIGPYEVEIRTTAYGVPHIVADDYGSVGFGMGWAHARDHLCTLADQIVKVRSERARYFGRGEQDANA
jgi:acyl-homoserine-lactone acylase